MKIKVIKRSPVSSTDTSEAMIHRCGSKSPKRTKVKTAYSYVCAGCRQEILIAASTSLSDANKTFNDAGYYVMRPEYVETASLEPVSKIVEVQEKNIRYTKLVPLTETELLHYYYGVDCKWEEVKDENKKMTYHLTYHPPAPFNPFTTP